MSTPTPRTDVAYLDAAWKFYNIKDAFAMRDFARLLERELAEATTELTAYRQGGLTEEILRRHDGSIKVGLGISFVLTADREHALGVAAEWRRILENADIYSTTPFLRDTLTALASVCREQKEAK